MGGCTGGCRSGVNKGADVTRGSSAVSPRIFEAMRSMGPSRAGLVWLGEAHSLSHKEENQKLGRGSVFPVRPLLPQWPERSSGWGCESGARGTDSAPGCAPKPLSVCVSEWLLPGCSAQFKDGHPTSGAPWGSSGGCRGKVFLET